MPLGYLSVPRQATGPLTNWPFRVHTRDNFATHNVFYPFTACPGPRVRALERAWTLLACGISLSFIWAGCRVRKDVPEGPSAEVVVAPVASYVKQVEGLASRDAGSDAHLILDGGVPPKGSFAVVFGGLESSPERPGPERTAAKVALAALALGKPPIDAVVEAVAVLEDHPDRNAGVGSSLRIDGKSVEMDAAVMAQDGRFGAVGALSRVKNPVRVARGVFDTPQRVLTGLGAQQFARTLGFRDFDPVTRESKASYRTLLRAELARDGGDASLLPRGWQLWVDASALMPEAGALTAEADAGGATDAGGAGDVAVEAAPAPKPAPPAAPRSRPPAPPLVETPPALPPPSSTAHDTVAALIRSPDGGFAGGVSSGGPPLTLPGRVGDVPTPGAALWVGKRGAVAVTGPGELIIDRGLARAVYDKLVALRSPKLAASWGLKQMPTGIAVSVVVLDDKSFAVAPPDAMAWVGSSGDKLSESATEAKP